MTERERLYQRLRAMQAERDDYARAIVIGLAGIVSTPERGYVADGGPVLAMRDLLAMRQRILADGESHD